MAMIPFMKFLVALLIAHNIISVPNSVHGKRHTEKVNIDPGRSPGVIMRID